MAIDFSQVKTIAIPEGSVTKITDSTGNILWADDTKYPYRQLEWINFTGNQSCDIGSTWIINKAYGIDIIIDYLSGGPNIEGALASNAGSFDDGGYICNIKDDYFTYRIGGDTSPHYVLNDYLPNNSERTLWTYIGATYMYFDIRDSNGNVLGNDSLSKIVVGNWPGYGKVSIGVNLKGVKIKSIKIADATTSSGPVINVGTITSKILPCQRKSDGKLGFYITSDNTFHPLSGTTTSYNIGPTADEYPDKMSINS